MFTLGEIGCMVQKLYCKPDPEPADLDPVLVAVAANADKLDTAQECLDDLKAREPQCMIVESGGKQLENCKCRNDIVVDGPSLSGGWVNSITDCQQCGSGDVCAKFKIWRKDTPRAYMMMGLNDNCADSDSYQDINFAFYSIIRNDVAVPYWIVYIYENGANRSWVVYDRQEIPECREFEIRRVGSTVEYYIDGNLVRSTADTTGGAELCLDSSVHGSLTTGQLCVTNQSVCEIIS